MKLSQEQIKAACEWWGKALLNPKFDNGDDSNAGGMGMVLAILANGNGPSAESVKRFEVELSQILSRETDKPSYFSIGTDYGPDTILGTAAALAGIATQFPWKTDMTFKDGGVQVAYGYRAQPVELLPELQSA